MHFLLTWLCMLFSSILPSVAVLKSPLWWIMSNQCISENFPPFLWHFHNYPEYHTLLICLSVNWLCLTSIDIVCNSQPNTVLSVLELCLVLYMHLIYIHLWFCITWKTSYTLIVRRKLPQSSKEYVNGSCTWLYVKFIWLTFCKVQMYMLSSDN